MTRLLISDDHGAMRAVIKQFFAAAHGLVIAGEAADGRETIERLAVLDVDVLVLDMSMPGLSGAALIAEIRKRHPDLPILVLSVHMEPLLARRALDAGASGYIGKDDAGDALLTAVSEVAAGRTYVDSRLRLPSEG